MEIRNKLNDLAYNLKWSWTPSTAELFSHIDSENWQKTKHNPVLLLKQISDERLRMLLADKSFVDRVNQEHDSLQRYLEANNTWFSENYGARDFSVAYFSAEFGLVECLPIYSGGLGVLAGDHLKSASDLGIPLVGVGLLYKNGYFFQKIDENGWQQEEYPDINYLHTPLTLVTDMSGNRVIGEVDVADAVVKFQIWKARVGRVDLYLLDTNLEENQAPYRDITDKLYGGDSEKRIQQEIVLGIGGIRALRMLGLYPQVYHMNEGHSAFLVLERMREMIQDMGKSFEEALETVRSTNVFTTHTPVAAGHDYFSIDLIKRYLQSYINKLGISFEQLLALGRKRPEDENELFCMTVLALKASGKNNGVSKLHGRVSQEMWRSLWPELPVEDVPIGYVTNGVHAPTWLSSSLRDILSDSEGNIDWQKILEVDDELLWRLHKELKRQLIELVNSRSKIGKLGNLTEDVLTIGFARRFATYKRATLLFSDEEKLAAILNNPQHPVQILFSGKAHPRDNGGKELIQKIVQLSKREPFLGKIAFIEDYDLEIARHLVRGCDVWLNNPVRPMEASGTSGMKASMNGVLNASTLDGWWAEAWESSNKGSDGFGWAIGDGKVYESPEVQNEVESRAIYELLEASIIPLFYDRDEKGIPRKWVRMVKEAVYSLGPKFTTDRMLKEYVEGFYMVDRTDDKILV